MPRKYQDLPKHGEQYRMTLLETCSLSYVRFATGRQLRASGRQ